jgi:ubiquinone/menaquinone biosynthesis C-methylase UbiE
MNDIGKAERETAGFWDKNAEGWGRCLKNDIDHVNETFGIPRFLDFIGNISGKTVLDAGCGEGRSSRHLANKGANVKGVDISPAMIELAKLEEQRNPLKIDFFKASCSDLSFFEKESFDSVYSYMALMDFPDIIVPFKEFHRVLKPGGQCAFIIRHPCFFTRGFGYTFTGDGKRAKLTVSDYFCSMPFIERWGFQAQAKQQRREIFETPRFSRKLSDYINGLISKGFVLENIQEPRPSQDECLKLRNLFFWQQHAALFLLVAARKT